MREPLQYFHFAGYVLLAAGIGAMLRSLAISRASLDGAITLIFFGSGILVGIWCCTRALRRKMTAT
jgi:hypothetical protein